VRAFWSLAGVVALVVAVIYGAAVGLTFLIAPSHGFDTDVTTRDQKLWGSPQRYAVLNQGHFAADVDRVIILGASNAREGLRPTVIDDALPGCTVDDLGLSGATMNINEVADSVQLVEDARPAGRRGRTIYVLGAIYTDFADDVPGTDNPTETEMLRYTYDREPDGGLQPRLPPSVVPAVAALARPVEFARAAPVAIAQTLLTPQLKSKVKGLLGRDKAPGAVVGFETFIAGQSDLDAVVLTDALRAELIGQRLSAAGGDRPLSPRQFRALDGLIERVTAAGDAFVIVDLPLPAWHTAGLPVRQASYRAQMAALVARHRDDPRVGYLDLTAMDDAGTFYDSAHAKPRTRVVWSRRLGDYLRAFVQRSAHAG